jgi:hypothetical protein
MNNHNAECQLFEIVFMLKTLIDGHENVALAVSLGNQLGIRKRAPSYFCNAHDLMLWKCLVKPRIDALV